MKYSLNVSIHKYKYKSVEVETEEEAKIAGECYRKEFYDENAPTLEDCNLSINLSDDNYCFPKGSMVSISYYGKLLPATVVYNPTSRYNRYILKYRYLESGRTVILANRPRYINKRVKLLCFDGEIGKEKCQDCVAKFWCYSHRDKKE